MGKKFWAILILVLATTCSQASAAPALSYLGMCQKTWPCERSLSAFDGMDTIRTGWLEHTFANDCQCADRLLSDPRPKEIRVHISNGPCLRNRRCGPYEVFSGETIASANRKVKRRNKKLIGKYVAVAKNLADRVAQSKGGLTCYVSPMLESDLDEEARTILHDITRGVLPGCSLVDNPHRRPCLPNTICEGHGATPRVKRPCIADMDGAPAESEDELKFLRVTRQCDLSFIWGLGLNCNTALGQKFIDPRKRDCDRPKKYYENLARYLGRV